MLEYMEGSERKCVLKFVSGTGRCRSRSDITAVYDFKGFFWFVINSKVSEGFVINREVWEGLEC